MPYSCNTWIGVFPGLAVIIFPKLQKPEKGALCMPKRVGKQKHTEASSDCHQHWRGRRRISPAVSARDGESHQSPGPAAAGNRQGERGLWGDNLKAGGRKSPKSRALQSLRTKPTEPVSRVAAARHLRPPRAQPGAARGAGPGRRPQPARGREGGAECPRVRPQPLGRGRREGALPRMPLESGLLRPASRAHHSRPCPARPLLFGRWPEGPAVLALQRRGRGAMPALGHSEKGRLGGRRKSGAERCPRSPGQPVPERSAPAPPPPPPGLPLSSRLASLLRGGRAGAEFGCSSAGHAPSLPGLRADSKLSPAYRLSSLLGARPRPLPSRLRPSPPARLLRLPRVPRFRPADSKRLPAYHRLGVAASLWPR